jgi:GT2 family glycosyltransferase
MCAPILCGEANAVAGGVELAEEIQRDWMTPHHREMLASTERIDSDEPVRMVGANMAIAKQIFDKISGFDPELGAGQLGSGEETLFSRQMREAGFRIEYAFDVVVEHHLDSSRLTREGFHDAARKRGRSSAHVNYHWRRHADWNVVMLLGGLIFWGMKLAWWRVRHVWRIRREGMAIEEFEIIKRLYRVRQHLTEKLRRPKYAADQRPSERRSEMRDVESIRVS